MKKKVIRVLTVDASYGLLKGQLNFLNNYYKVIGVSSPGINVKKVEASEGIQTFQIPMERRIAPVKDLKSLYLLYKLFRKEKPFIVHSLTPKAGLLSMIASFFAGVPHRIHTFTGLIFPYKKGLFQKILIFTDRLLCSCATKIYPEGLGVKKDLEKFNITKKPLKVIANGNINGIDLNYFDSKLFSDTYKKQLRKELNISKDDFVFVFAGRIVRDKGINELVKAFEILLQKNSSVKLLILGDYEKKLDPVTPFTENFINNCEAVISVGWQQDVRPYFSIAQCLVFPSYREGFPNTVIQAGAMKIPSIVTNISGCNEIIIEGENGTIIPSKNSDALYEKMIQIVDKKIIFSPETCRNLIQERYEQGYVWKKILKEYQNLK